MGLPADVVLDGFTLIDQHRVDHEFLLNGSPFSIQTPLWFAATMVGIVLVAVGLLCWAFRRGSRAGIATTLVVGAVLATAKLWWLAISLVQQFDDGQVFGYALRYYPTYWGAAGWASVVIAAIGLVAALIVLIIGPRGRRRRRP
ncbi:hypothetical protein ACEE23_01530 [Corynebacterium sp. 32222D000AT]|uniref:hypothetical protein n=1 Tax=unclassified Corynebacterium TaxID=2624378 RepID=UPI002A92A931|nr:hypothetical protein [Mycobacteriaceae bacterium]MDY5829731.1 hypothetical protein [Corynebacterium sp.]